MNLIFASTNKNKISEIKSMLPSLVNLKSLEDAGIKEEIPETGSTIKENALLKAQYVHEHFKRNNQSFAVFADDSGLEVEALGNAPGVYSARYAGIPKNDAANNLKLLFDLQNETKRQARFVTVIALILNDEVHYFEGEIKGTIAVEARGDSGFGYDPLFIPQGYHSSFAELGMEVKNSISHRSIAVGKLVSFLGSALSV